MKIACPSCGGEVDFKSRFSVYQVCPYCTSMLIRTDKNVENIGKTADLPNDMSPFQLGTTGVFEKKHFQIIGKQRLSYEDGFWNEYFLIFDDQSYGWLGEAQGFLMVSVPVDVNVPDSANIRNGMAVNINGKTYEVDDIKRVTCAGGAGELPVRGVKGRQFVSADLTGVGETFASIDYSEKKPQVFTGRYVEIEELKCENLREIDGW